MYNRLFTIIAVTSGASALRRDMRTGEALGLKADNFIDRVSNGLKSMKDSVVGAVNGVGSAIYGSSADARYRSAIEYLPLPSLQPKDMLVQLQQRLVDVTLFLEFADQDNSFSRDDLDVKIAEAELKSVNEMIAMIENSAEDERNSLNGVTGAARALSFYQWRRSKGWKDAYAFSSDIASITSNAVKSAVNSTSKYVNKTAAALSKKARKTLRSLKNSTLKNVSNAARNIAEGANAVADSVEPDEEE